MENDTLVENNKLIELVKGSNLDESKRNYILTNFQSYFQIAKEWEEKAKALVITDISQIAEMKQAREGRLFLREKRILLEKSRKDLKDASLQEGRTIDAIAKMLTGLIEPTENYLEEQENFAKVQEEKRKKALKEQRELLLAPYNVITSVYDLGSMDEQTFQFILEGTINAHNKAIEKAKQEEIERQERQRQEAEEKEKMKLENERLRKEAEEKEKILQQERQEQAEKEKAEKEKRRLEIAKADELLRLEREAKAKLEREKAEQERKRQEEEKAKAKAEKQARLAPDKDKLILLAQVIADIKLPELKSGEAFEILQNIKILLQKTEKYIIEKANEL